MTDADILLCDERAQERSVWSVYSGVAGAPTSAGRPPRRRGGAAGRVVGGADAALWQGRLPLRAGRGAWPVCLLRAEDGWPGTAAVRACGTDRSGAPLRA